MWSVHTVEYYSTKKRKEILTHAAVWINLESIMLSEISQKEKDNCMILPTRGTKNSQNSKKQKEWWLLGLGGERKIYCVMNRVSVLQGKESSGDG